MSHINKNNYNQIAAVGRIPNLMRIHAEKHLQRCKKALQTYCTAIKAHSRYLRKKVDKTVKMVKSWEAVAHMFHIAVLRMKRYLRQCRKRAIVSSKLMPRRSIKKRPPLQAGLRYETQIKMIEPHDTQVKMIEQSTTVKKN